MFGDDGTCTPVLLLAYGWILFCGWAKERGRFGPEFWIAVFSPVIAVVTFLIALVFNIFAPPSVVADPVLLLFYIYFLLPIPGMTWLSAAFGWRPDNDRTTDKRRQSQEQASSLLKEETMASTVSPQAKAHFDEGKRYWDKHDLDKAILAYDEAIRLQPDYASAYHNRGLAYREKNEADRAIQDFSKALTLRRVADTYTERGRVYHSKGELERALADLDQAIQVAPSYVPAYFYRALVLQDLDQLADALSNLSDALALNPDKLDERASILYNRAIVYRNLGQYDEAITDLTEAGKHTPNDPDVWVARGGYWLSKGDIRRARSDLDRAVRLSPRDAKARFARGTLYWSIKKYKRSIADLTIGLEIEPHDIRALTMRGLSYREKGDYDRAIRDFNQALRIKPDHTAALNGRSETRRRKRAYKRALDDISDAIAIEPDNAAFLSNRAAIWIELGRLEEARQDCTRAIDVDPNYAHGYYNLAMVQFRRGEKEEATSSLQRAFSLDPRLKRRGLVGRALSQSFSRERGRDRPSYDQLIFELGTLMMETRVPEIYDYVAANILWFDHEFMAYLRNEVSSDEARLAGAATLMAMLFDVLQGARFMACLGDIGARGMVEVISDPQLDQVSAEKLVRNLFERYGDAGPDSIFGCVYEASQSADALGGSAVERRNHHLLLDATRRYGASVQTALELAAEEGEPLRHSATYQVASRASEREIVALIDSLLQLNGDQAAYSRLQQNGEVAARVIGLVLAGRIRTRSEFLLFHMDDMSLEHLWKLEKVLVAIGPVAAPHIRPLLENDRWQVQFIAAQTLGYLKDRESVASLLKLLERSPGRLSMAAAQALGKIGDPSAVPLLQRALQRANDWDKDAITEALTRLAGSWTASDP